ncbi:MAG: glycosyltransferase family 39 protein, partial [Planctomycetota bacterium]
MRERAWDWAWIAVIGGILFFTNLGGPGLWDEDEPIYAACAREMIQRNDWVVPRYNGEMFPDKPPLMFWMMMSGFGLFGYTELGARFLSAVAAVLAAWATYELGRRLFSRKVAFWGTVMAMSNLLYVVSARAATVDAALTLLTVGTMLAFVVAYGPVVGLRSDHVADDAQNDRETPADRPETWAVWAMWACMAVAILAKGPIGLLLPAAAIGLFLMIVGRTKRDEPVHGLWIWRALVVTARVWDPRNFGKAFVRMQPWWAFPAVALFAVPWFVWVGVRTEGAWLREFFAMYNLRPFTQPIQGHRGPIWYHVASLLGGFFPWSVFIGLVFHDAIRRIARRDKQRDGLIFCLTWLGIWFVFWSICSTKLPHYLLPAFPAVGLLTAAFFERWCEGTLPVRRWEVNTAMGITIVVGLGIMIAVPVAAAALGLPGLGWTGGL